MVTRVAAGLFLLGAALILGEAAARLWPTVPAVEPVRRHHPYLMNGRSFPTPDDPWAEIERPETYGYRETPLAYLYDFTKPVTALAERWDFLFQDRRPLAAPPSSADGPLRVFALGGSVAYGMGASSPERRWFVQLERALAARLGRPVRVIPAAMPGYVSAQERLVLDLAVLPRRPDAVILLDGYNDAALPAMYGVRPGDPFDQGLAYKGDESLAPVLIKRAAVHSRLVRALATGMLQTVLAAHRREIAEDPRRLAFYSESVASVYRDNVSAILTRCAQAHLPCVAFLQPARSATRRLAGFAPADDQDRIETAAYAAILAAARREEDRLPLHDLTPAPPSEALYLDSVHVGDEGHRLLAEAMAPTVEALLAGRSRDSNRG